MSKISIRGVNFDDVSMAEAIDIVKGFMKQSGIPKVIHTPNSEIVQLCIEQPQYYNLINSADLVIPDGSGVILASKILGTPLKKGKVAGVELGEHIAELAAENGWRLFLLGGKPGVSDVASDKLTEKYIGLNVCGTNDGYFKDVTGIIDKINNSGTDILFVCFGVPKQELWIREHLSELKVKAVAGLGGSVDIYAGTAKRAPDIFIKLGLEWFHRLLKDPRRIGRMMKLPKFLFGTILAKMTEKKKK